MENAVAPTSAGSTSGGSAMKKTPFSAEGRATIARRPTRIRRRSVFTHATSAMSKPPANRGDLRNLTGSDFAVTTCRGERRCDDGRVYWTASRVRLENRPLRRLPFDMRVIFVLLLVGASLLCATRAEGAEPACDLQVPTAALSTLDLPRDQGLALAMSRAIRIL